MFQLCASVPDLLKKIKREIPKLGVIITGMPLTLYQINSMHCLDNLAHSISFNSSFGVN